MKTRLLGALCACFLVLPAVANAAFYDFQQWVTDNSEQGFNNAAPFSLADGGLILTATAYEQPGMLDSHVYLDGLFNGVIGGMGVCTTLTGGNQCTPSSDDNVSIDGTHQETLAWDFSSAINGLTLELGDSVHVDFNNSFQYSIDNGSTWLIDSTDVNGFVTLNFGSSTSKVEFRTVGAATTDQFYIRNATVVPIPPAVWLFASGLLGMIGIARRKKIV